MRNYTTSVKEEKTIMEIEAELAAHGATGIEKHFAQDGPQAGKVTAFAFSINWGGHGERLKFRLPLNAEAARVAYRGPRQRTGATPAASRSAF